MITDTVMQDIQAAIATFQGGDRALAREQLGVIWNRIRHAPRSLHECTLAHFMADAQDDPTVEPASNHRCIRPIGHIYSGGAPFRQVVHAVVVIAKAAACRALGSVSVRTSSPRL